MSIKDPNKPKILVIGKYYPPFNGGIEQVTELYCNETSRISSLKVLVNSHCGPKKVEEINGVEIVRLKTNIVIKSQPIALSLPFAFDCRDYDAIHFHGPNPYAAAVLTLKMFLSRARTKILVTHHMDIFGRPLLRGIAHPFYSFLLRRAKWVTVTSQKNAAISRDLPRQAKIEVLPLSVNPLRYDLSEDRRVEARAWRHEHFGPAPLIGFLGRHARYKGLDVLIRALAELPDVQAIVAGSGPYGEDARKLSRELGIDHRITFPGSLTDAEKSRMLMAIDAFVFPSTETTEAFGIGQLEAMWHGTPVVASNLNTGVTDVSIDGETALLAEPGNARHLAAQIRRILAAKELGSTLAARAKDHVVRNFTDEIIASKLRALLREALHQS